MNCSECKDTGILYYFESGGRCRLTHAQHEAEARTGGTTCILEPCDFCLAGSQISRLNREGIDFDYDPPNTIWNDIEDHHGVNDNPLSWERFVEESQPTEKPESRKIYVATIQPPNLNTAPVKVLKGENIYVEHRILTVVDAGNVTYYHIPADYIVYVTEKF